MIALCLVAASVTVPIDWADPASPRVDLGYELGADFDPAKPTVVFVTDGQQFRVARGRMKDIQAGTFGGGFNVVGIYGRGAEEPFQKAATREDGSVDWVRAWTIFRAEQWVEDVEAVRRAVLGADGKVALYGASGGALLAHQYVAAHGDRVIRVFTAASVEPWVAGDLGIDTDRFEDEITPEDRTKLREALAQGSVDRDLAMMLLQRQNFFVPPASLAKERSELIAAIATGDSARMEALRKDYQVDAVRKLIDSPRGIAIRVREYEFAVPAGEVARLASGRIAPDLEVHVTSARPLLDLHAAGKIPAPQFDATGCHRFEGEVLVLAGLRDHTVDWRTSIAVAARYPRGRLLLVDDDHMFSDTRVGGTYDELLRSFLADGFSGEAVRTAWRSRRITPEGAPPPAR